MSRLPRFGKRRCRPVDNVACEAGLWTDNSRGIVAFGGRRIASIDSIVLGRSSVCRPFRPLPSRCRSRAAANVGGWAYGAEWDGSGGLIYECAGVHCWFSRILEAGRIFEIQG